MSLRQVPSGTEVGAIEILSPAIVVNFQVRSFHRLDGDTVDEVKYDALRTYHAAKTAEGSWRLLKRPGTERKSRVGLYVDNRINIGMKLLWYAFARVLASISWCAAFSMHFLGHFLVAASSMIILCSASSSNYDPIVSSFDDSSFSTMGTDNSQEADLFPEQSLWSEQAGLSFLEPDSGFPPAAFASDHGTDSGAIVPDADKAPSSMGSDTSWLASDSEISCTGDDIQATKNNQHRTRDMCMQESPEKEPILPEIPNILNLRVKNRFPPDGFLIPWDDSQCYPPYTNHLCCTGPATQLDWLTTLYADVRGCSACSFCVKTLYPLQIT